MNKLKQNLLLIAGTGRNTGKTTIAEFLINHFSPKHNIVALKISPHFHELTNQQEIVVDNGTFIICKEKQGKAKKDSQKMLQAGAVEAYYIQVKDCHLYEAFSSWLKIIPKNKLIVCESPALRRFVKPALFIVTDHSGNIQKKEEIVQWMSLADLQIKIDQDNLTDLSNKIYIKQNQWFCKK